MRDKRITVERNVLMSKEMINSQLSRQQLEKELKRVENRNTRTGAIRKALLWILLLMILVVTVSALWFPVYWIADETGETSGSGQAVLTMRTQQVDSGDLVVCYRGEHPELQQVAATAGARVDVDDQGYLLLAGKKLFAAGTVGNISVVPDDCMLLLDGASDALCCVRSDEIAGKVILQLWPLGYNDK